jgi:hypothetical protein
VQRPLLPQTRFVVAMSALVPAVFSLPMLFAPDFWNDHVLPQPFDPTPRVILGYIAGAYLALTIAGVYVLWRNDWPTARGYLAYSATYNALAIVVSVIAAATGDGAPGRVWLYVALAVAYVALTTALWRRQEAAVEASRM